MSNDIDETTFVPATRGVNNYNHPRMKEFRSMIDGHLTGYEKSNKTQKTELIDKITKEIAEDEGTQFMRPKRPRGDEWIPLTEEEIRKKVAHRFRDALKARVKKQTLEPEPFPTGSRDNPVPVDANHDIALQQSDVQDLTRALGVTTNTGSFIMPQEVASRPPQGRGQERSDASHVNLSNASHLLASGAHHPFLFALNNRVPPLSATSTEYKNNEVHSFIQHGGQQEHTIRAIAQAPNFRKKMATASSISTLPSALSFLYNPFPTPELLGSALALPEGGGVGIETLRAILGEVDEICQLIDSDDIVVSSTFNNESKSEEE